VHVATDSGCTALHYAGEKRERECVCVCVYVCVCVSVPVGERDRTLAAQRFTMQVENRERSASKESSRKKDAVA
jgi:hypothetical protein